MIKLSNGVYLDERRVISAQPSASDEPFTMPMRLVVEGLPEPIDVSESDWRRICDRLGVRN